MVFFEKIKLFIKSNCFSIVSAFLCVLACGFHFWLAYPGWFNLDTINLMCDKYDLQPIVMYYIFQFLFKLFGTHLWIGLILLLVPFYLGLWFIILAFYKRYNSWWALIFFSLMFVQNIFIQLFILLATSYVSVFSFLVYAILLYIIMVPPKKIPYHLIFLLIVTYILALFVRHNGIVQVYPACLIAVYLCLKDKLLSKKQFIIRYTIGIIVTAIISIIIFVIPSHVLPVYFKCYPAQHLIINQLAGICVPAEDSSCFDEKWFLKGKTWQDLKITHKMHPASGDTIAFYGTPLMVIDRWQKCEGIEKKWVRAIIKYPLNFIKHEFFLIKTMWTQEIFFVEFEPAGPISPFYNGFNYRGQWTEHGHDIFPQDELYLHETPLKLSIVRFWDNYFLKMPTMGWIIILSILCINSFILLFLVPENIFVIYCFITAFGGLSAAVVYGGFYPDPFPRYIFPIWSQCISATLAFIAFSLDVLLNKK